MRPWSSIDIAALPDLPAMLGGEERQFLYWLGLESNGDALVDLGTFFGASAACMAAGAEAAGSSSKVWSYDLFEYGPWCDPYLDPKPGYWTRGDSTLPLVRPMLRDRSTGWHERIELIHGDIAKQHWNGGEIGALFVDFTQNWAHHNHVCRAFLPHLKLGGVLAHQDYLYVVCYWLHIFMERWRDHFEVISPLIMNSTAAWRYTEPLPETAFARGLQEDMTFSEMLALLERSIERYDGDHRILLRVARARFFLHAKGPDAATREIDAIECDGAVPHIAAFVQAARDEFARSPQSGGMYEGFFRP